MDPRYYVMRGASGRPTDLYVFGVVSGTARPKGSGDMIAAGPFKTPTEAYEWLDSEQETWGRARLAAISCLVFVVMCAAATTVAVLLSEAAK